MVVTGGLTNSWEKKRSKRQRRRGKIYPSECRVPKIARRDKKACLSDQCKEIEKNDRLEKTRDCFKKIRDTKGTFHAKMGTIKDRNGMDLTGTEDIKKRWQKYTEELYKKGLSETYNHDGVITHLKPDMLESKVKWALGSITTNKASRGDGIPAELFKIQKDDAVKCCTQYACKFGKLSSGLRTGKDQFHSIPKERQCQRKFKLPHNYTHLTQSSSVQLLSRVRHFVTPWTAACQASLSSPTPGACSNSCPLSQWCHPTISSSLIPFSSPLRSFPASGSF